MLSPKSGQYYGFRGNLKRSQGKYKVALTDLEQAISLGDRQSAVYVDKGCCLSELGDLPGAESALTEGIRLTPDESKVYMTRGLVYHNQGQYEKAVKDF
ncbi:MAG: tetratricopeptide repeat protein, partial [Candidatus Obscuribacterales bacterium]|nr:tetratricopeptide repeat protein [Candidatus Obscuribacterales bacterium]